MNSFDDIAILWKAPGSLKPPGAEAIIQKAAREKSRLAKKILIQSVCMLLSIVSIIYVVAVIRFNFMITYIGLSVMFACILVFAFIRFRQSMFLRKLDFSQSPAALLQKAERFYVKQRWMNTTGVLWYTIVLNIAFAMYFYEIIALAPFTTTWKCILIAIYITWMLIATLWIGKRSVRKEHASTRKLIEKLRELKQELEQQ
jgi:hypothetical protein